MPRFVSFEDIDTRQTIWINPEMVVMITQDMLQLSTVITLAPDKEVEVKGKVEDIIAKLNEGLS